MYNSCFKYSVTEPNSPMVKPHSVTLRTQSITIDDFPKRTETILTFLHFGHTRLVSTALVCSRLLISSLSQRSRFPAAAVETLEDPQTLEWDARLANDRIATTVGPQMTAWRECAR